MKLSSTLLQTIALSVSVSALAITTTSCEKDNERPPDRDNKEEPREPNPDTCSLCGMG